MFGEEQPGMPVAFHSLASIGSDGLTSRSLRIQYYQACRKPEKALNSCVLDKLVRERLLLVVASAELPPVLIFSSSMLQSLKKTIPGTPEGQVPVHEKKRPIFTTVQK
jgi:NADH dehydrogenase (ubiquinone) 1 alpha subcomplex subunit 8